MYWTCYNCGEVFEIPSYRKDRVGNKVACCPACESVDVEEYDDFDPDDVIDYEIWTEEEYYEHIRC